MSLQGKISFIEPKPKHLAKRYGVCEGIENLSGMIIVSEIPYKMWDDVSHGKIVSFGTLVRVDDENPRYVGAGLSI